MQLGSRFLGDLVSRFDGSYILAAAAYNAGPNRPAQWIATCGDPRSAGTDPVDYIECIPIGETRNYVMRVLENIQVYRARLNDGRAPLTLPADLKRGGYGQAKSYTELAQNSLTASPSSPPAIADVIASTPVPDPLAGSGLIRARDTGHYSKAVTHKVSAKARRHKARHKKSAKS